MMEPDTIANPTELIHKLYQTDVPLNGAPLMQTARTTETAPEIICDARTEKPLHRNEAPIDFLTLQLTSLNSDAYIFYQERISLPNSCAPLKCRIAQVK
jgi:hypothetical protein